MDIKGQQFGIWSLICAGPFMVFTFWLLADFVPLPSPAMDAQQVASMYLDNSLNIRITAAAYAFLWAFWLPFSAAIAAQMSRAERGFPYWSLVQFGGGIGLMLIVMLNSLLWGIASFRPDRSPDTILALHDLAWILFTMPAGPLGFQILSVGICALGDKNPVPVFPRWFGYMSIWGCLLTLTGFLVIFFKTGPFAWNGILAFWMPACVVGLWASCLIILMLKGIKIQQKYPVNRV